MLFAHHLHEAAALTVSVAGPPFVTSLCFNSLPSLQPALHGRHDKIDFWDNVYGFNFRPIRAVAMAEPLVDFVEPDQVGAANGAFWLASKLPCDIQI